MHFFTHLALSSSTHPPFNRLYILRHSPSNTVICTPVYSAVILPAPYSWSCWRVDSPSGSCWYHRGRASGPCRCTCSGQNLQHLQICVSVQSSFSIELLDVIQIIHNVFGRSRLHILTRNSFRKLSKEGEGGGGGGNWRNQDFKGGHGS